MNTAAIVTVCLLFVGLLLISVFSLYLAKQLVSRHDDYLGAVVLKSLQPENESVWKVIMQFSHSSINE